MKKPTIFLIGTLFFCILIPVLISALFYGKDKVSDADVKTQKLEKNAYGYKTYSAVVKNTTSDDFNYFAFNINLNDKDGVTVETTTASTDNWEAGTKHRFEFGTEKSFKSIEIKSCTWDYD